MTKAERRQARRYHTIEQHRITGAKVRPGHGVVVIDVSAGGALIETERRLLPGSVIELHLTNGERSAMMRGRVLRCAVERLRASAIAYRGAVGFDRELPWFGEAEGCGYAVPTAEMRRYRPRAASATHVAV